MNNFDNWLKQYNADDLSQFSKNSDALLWLKLKSIARKEHLAAFVQQNQLSLISNKLNEQWRELYSLLQSHSDAHNLLDTFIRAKNQEILPLEQLVSELYKMQSFSWGGNYQNDLDRYLVDNFIKKYHRFDDITAEIETKINVSVSNYVFCSWYNHWSSILIEHLFKQHPIVLPTIGLIKKVDFFVEQIPFDLKVTYLPEGYIAAQRKQRGLKPELTELKGYARKYGIHFDNKATDDTLAYEITQKLSDANIKESDAILETRRSILQESIENPKLLIQWLYENQGDRRFDASNRIFLIVVDRDNWGDSWKLKRNLNLLKPAINQWLDNFNPDLLQNFKIEFNFKGKLYHCFADVIFAVKE